MNTFIVFLFFFMFISHPFFDEINLILYKGKFNEKRKEKKEKEKQSSI